MHGCDGCNTKEILTSDWSKNEPFPRGWSAKELTYWDYVRFLRTRTNVGKKKRWMCSVCDTILQIIVGLSGSHSCNWHQSNNTFRRKEKEDWEDQLRQRELKRSRINPRLDRDESLKRIENCCPGDSCICYIGEERPWVPTIYNRGLSPQNIVKWSYALPPRNSSVIG